MRKSTLILLLSLAALTSCEDKYPDLEDGLYAEIKTDKGSMLAQLYYEKTPVTVASFVSLAEGNSTMVDSTYKGKKYFDGLTFHRIMKDFMIQGGDPLGTGAGDPGYKFFDEFDPELRHDTIGVLSMANSGYGTNGSQFFITDKATPFLDAYDEDGNPKNCEGPRVSCHVVFGKLVDGFKTLTAIAGVEVPNPQDGKPKTPVNIEKVTIIRKGREAKKFDAPKVFEEGLAANEAEAKKAAEEKAKAQEMTITAFENLKAQATTLDSGLSYVITEKGNGAKPENGQQILVNYAGYFPDGGLFDTNIKEVADKYGMQTRPNASQYQPMSMPYGPDAGMIAGFKEGLMQMQVGDKATLFIPYHLAYGENGYGPIPSKADLIFEMEMVKIGQ